MRAMVQEQVDIPVELAMRYGNPSIEEAMDRIVQRGVNHLYIMPMYPHYAMSSYEAVVVKVEESIREKSPHLQRTFLQPFYRDPDYIEALAQSIAPHLSDDLDKILFSYHGVPERHLRKTDPSHHHCLNTPDCCSVRHPAHATCYRVGCVWCVISISSSVSRQSVTKAGHKTAIFLMPWLGSSLSTISV